MKTIIETGKWIVAPIVMLVLLVLSVPLLIIAGVHYE
jgi:hypothetical protein